MCLSLTLMIVPFNTLKVQIDRVKVRYLQEVSKLLDSGYFILDSHVEKFEEEWAKYCGAKYCVGVSSGTDALYLALKALDIGKGQNISVSPNAYYSDVEAIVRTGANPFIESKPFIQVHLYGSIGKAAKVEDCAQAHGYKPKGIGCWSFYPTKSLGAVGDAGAITTDDKKLYEKLRALRDLGQTKKNQHDYQGGTFRLDPIQAIYLSLQFPFLDEDLEFKRILCNRYASNLEGFEFIVPDFPHVFPIFINNRDEIKERLEEAGVSTAVHYPTPVWKHKAFKIDYDNSLQEERFNKELSLPLFIGMTTKQQDYVLYELKKFRS